MAGVAITFRPLTSVTAIILLSQTENRTPSLLSRARPDGESHGARDEVRSTAGLAASISTMELLSSRLTKSFPVPSATQNSGFPPTGNVFKGSPVFASIAVESLERPLKVKIRWVLGS